MEKKARARRKELDQIQNSQEQLTKWAGLIVLGCLPGARLDCGVAAAQ